jgi:hypothetical protein
MDPESDRNFLHAVFALRNGYITEEQFFRVTAIWTKNPSRDIGSIFVELKMLSEDENTNIKRILEDRMRRLGGLASTISLDIQKGFDFDPKNLPEEWAERMNSQTKDIDIKPNAEKPTSSRITWVPRTGLSRYELQHVIGIGGQGIVFQAFDNELHRKVALKKVKPELVSDPGMAKQLVEEAQNAGRFDHGGIAPVYDIGADHEGNPFFIMQLVRGDKLSDQGALINYKSNSREQFILEIRPFVRRIIDVCNTLQYAFDKFGIIHQDLKPENIMVDRYGETIVMDWGLGRRVQLIEGSSIQLPISENTDSNGRPRPGSGTPGYLSPEQAQSLNTIDHRTDVWGVGATLYKLLTGEVANKGRNRLELVDNARKNRYFPPTQLNGLIPKELEAICLKAMAKEPSSRYQNTTDLAADLERWIAGDPVSAMPEGQMRKAERFLRRHSRLAITSMLAICVGFTGLLGAYLSVRNAWQQTLDSRKLVSDVLGKIVGDTLDDGWSQDPGGDETRIALLSKVATETGKIVVDHPDDLNLKLDYLNILIRLGSVQNRVDTPNASGTWSIADELIGAYKVGNSSRRMDERWKMAALDMRRYYFENLWELKLYESAKEQNTKALAVVNDLFQNNSSDASIATSYALLHLQRIVSLRSEPGNENENLIMSEFQRIENAMDPHLQRLKESIQKSRIRSSDHGTILTYILTLIEKAEWFDQQNKKLDRNATWLNILESSKLATAIPKAHADGLQFQIGAYLALHSISTENQDGEKAKGYLQAALESQTSEPITDQAALDLFLICTQHVSSFAALDLNFSRMAIQESTEMLERLTPRLDRLAKMENQLRLSLSKLALAIAEKNPIALDQQIQECSNLLTTLKMENPESEGIEMYNLEFENLRAQFVK